MHTIAILALNEVVALEMVNILLLDGLTLQVTRGPD
jgi:hypothetical protein